MTIREEIIEQDEQPTLTAPRRVPWSGLDVLFLFFLWIFLMYSCIGVTRQVFPLLPPGVIPVVETTSDHAGENLHPMTQLLLLGGNAGMILLIAFFSAVVMAPIAEEFFYRRLLQGWLRDWLEGFVFQSCDHLPAGKNALFLPGFFSIVITSILFGAAHSGTRQDLSLELLAIGITGMALANLFFLFLASLYLVVVRRATFADLGFPGFNGIEDVLLPTALALLVFPAMIGLNGMLRMLFPDFNLEPIPLFFFALVLGGLVHRSDRLLPCIVLHACFNAASFAALILFVLFQS